MSHPQNAYPDRQSRPSLAPRVRANVFHGKPAASVATFPSRSPADRRGGGPESRAGRDLAQLQDNLRRASAGARQHQPGSEAGRISLHRRPFGMRQVHAAALDRRAESADLGKSSSGWQAREWAGNRSHSHLPGSRIVSLADGRRQRRVRHEDEERQQGRARGEGAVLSAPRPSFQIWEQLHPSTLGRHAAASRVGASAWPPSPMSC